MHPLKKFKFEEPFKNDFKFIISVLHFFTLKSLLKIFINFNKKKGTQYKATKQVSSKKLYELF